MVDQMYEPMIPPLDIPTGWRHVEDVLPLGENTKISSQYDWLIVGAGITGISAARRLGALRGQDRILLVDAHPVGWGTSGRNSGFLIDLPHKFDFDRPDPDRLSRVIRLNRMAISELAMAVENHDINCDWSAVGKLQCAVQQRGIVMLQKFCEALNSVNEPYEVLEREACREIIGTDYYARAVYTKGSILLDPCALVRGLASHLPENVSLCDTVAVTEFGSLDHGFRTLLRDSSGDTQAVTSRKVILATNPWTSGFGYMTDRILPMMTFASITRALTATERKRYKGRMNWGLTPVDAAGTTLRMTADGRLMIRNHYAYAPKFKAEDKAILKVREAHRKGIDKRFPQLAHVPFSATWGGVVSLSRNHETFFGEIGEGVYSANCYNGVGMTRGAISGKLLADLATGQSSSELEDIISVSGMPSKLPPRLALATGLNIRMRIAKWQSREEI